MARDWGNNVVVSHEKVLFDHEISRDSCETLAPAPPGGCSTDA